MTSQPRFAARSQIVVPETLEPTADELVAAYEAAYVALTKRWDMYMIVLGHEMVTEVPFSCMEREEPRKPTEKPVALVEVCGLVAEHWRK